MFWLLLAQPTLAIDVTVGVYVDPNGDGDLSDAIPAQGVDVVGYLDLFDGVPTGLDDVATLFGTTGPAGTVTLNGSDGTWWFAVDAADVLPGLVVEQTWGSRGTLCADGAGFAIQRGTDGPCFGGRTGAGTDLQIFNVGVAEHVAEASGAGLVEVAFAFASNVVTQTGTGQGSLDAALANAAISPIPPVRFTPAVPPDGAGNGNSWWTLAPPTAPWTAPGLEVDGQAWCNGISCALLSLRNDAANPLSPGGPVGVGPDGLENTGDETLLPAFDPPELLISPAGAITLGADVVVRNIAINGGGFVLDGDRAAVDHCLVGTDPGDGAHIPVALYGIRVSDGVNDASVRDNHVAVDFSGIRRDGGGSGLRIERNEVTAPAGGHTATADGILLITSTEEAGTTLRHNRIHNQRGAGMELGWSGGVFNDVLIEENTIANNGFEAPATPSTESMGVLIRNLDPSSTTTLRGNQITGNAGAGVAIQLDAAGVRLTANAIHSNGGLGIDLDPDEDNPNQEDAGDGVSPNDGVRGGTGNDGMDSPTLDRARVSATRLEIGGVVGPVATPLAGNHELECYLATDDGNNGGPVELGDGLDLPHGEPTASIDLCLSEADGTFDCTLAVPPELVLTDLDAICCTATDLAGSTSECGVNRPLTKNLPPTGVPDVYTADRNDPVRDLDVLLNDSTEPGETLAIQGVSAGSDGGSIATDGLFVQYQPAPGFSGTELFTYTLTDGFPDDDVVVDVTVNVLFAQIDPIAADDAYDVPEDSIDFALDALANDTVDTAGTLTIDSASPGSAGGQTTHDGTQILYTPAPNFTGPETFDYIVSDGIGGLALGRVTVTVTPVNDPPHAVDDAITVDEDSGTTAIDVLANDDSAPDLGEILVVDSVSAGSAGGVITTDGTTVSYRPQDQFFGTETFTYDLSDSNGGVDTATVLVTVLPVNDDPTAVDDTAAVPADGPEIAIDVLANDFTAPDLGEALEIAAVDVAAGSVRTDGLFVYYTPPVGFSGTDAFHYDIVDGNGGAARAEVTVTVSGNSRTLSDTGSGGQIAGKGPSGCGCSAASTAPDVLWLILGPLLLRRRSERPLGRSHFSGRSWGAIGGG